ncbi:unnamed protein product [Rotaria sordida]|uniref:USP domain-containing protein n=1 Tax=Rotaria sordida TaxID=392033 RepID=A0A814SQQ6_9BILA|nr:unnamed protein product [Rotaria sordida]CAF1386835.1 unnamed protein product [Rotaria sordida]
MSSSSSSSSRISTLVENESLLLKTIKHIYNEYEYREISLENIQIFTEKFYQIWMRPQIISNIINRNKEGYLVIEYLEQLLLNDKMNDNFFILIINTLVKNENFYYSFLNDHKRFKQLFNLSIRKPVYLMRYIELLYYYCPLNFISNIGLEFYRFVVDTYFIKYLHQISYDIDWLAAFSTLLYQFYENTTKNFLSKEFIFTNQKDSIDYSIYVINTLLHHHLNVKSSKDFIYDLKLINIIIKTITVVWKQNPSTENSTHENQDRITPIQFRSIEYLFDIMSTDKSSDKDLIMNFNKTKIKFSSAILSLFPHIQLNTADIILKTMFTDGHLNGERLSIMIKYLIEFIDAPIQLIQHIPYETWITGLCTALVKFNQHEYLRKLIDETILFLINHLFYYETYDNAIKILFWFVRYDKRIETFQYIINYLSNLFQQLNINNNDDLKMKIIELCHMGIAIHPEYDISNEIILKEIFYKFPQPDLNILLNHKNIHIKYHSIIFNNENKIKNRVGIINLGNTCYVNSILQALYQCDLFRKYILEYHFNQQTILSELQIIFAQLNLSKRPYINAVNLVQIARPTWFTINEQQDCAEFLGYLLDTIKDEEKKSLSNEIERLFTIRTCQINRCQRCSIESYRQETSNYLFLPIPILDNQYDNLNNNNNNNNQSTIPISIMKNGLKFYAASNRNSTSDDDQIKSIATSLVQSNTINRFSLPNLSSNTSIRSHSPPSSYINITNNIIHNSSNLQFVFDCYFQKEELKDDNQYRCEHCRSLQNAERYIILQTAPEYLILSLNRFEYDKKTNTFRKIFTKINYPKILNVNINPLENLRNNSILIKYCLILIIVHTGYTLHGGHYYVYAREIKQPLLSKINNHEQEDYFSNDEWFLLNDDLVQISSYEAMIENCAQYTSATPYILFYKRIDKQRIEEMEQTKQIHIHESLIEQIHEDNIIYEQELEKQST